MAAITDVQWAQIVHGLSSFLDFEKSIKRILEKCLWEVSSALLCTSCPDPGYQKENLTKFTCIEVCQKSNKLHAFTINSHYTTISIMTNTLCTGSTSLIANQLYLNNIKFK